MADSSTPSERMYLLPKERQLKKFFDRAGLNIEDYVVDSPPGGA